MVNISGMIGKNSFDLRHFFATKIYGGGVSLKCLSCVEIKPVSFNYHFVKILIIRPRGISLSEINQEEIQLPSYSDGVIEAPTPLHTQ